MKNNKIYYAKYSVLSRGSEEKGGFKGYIWVGENNNNWVITQDEHGILKSEKKAGMLECNGNKNIKSLAIARFQLMAAIMMKKNKKFIDKNSKILLLGLGNVGLGTILELIRNNRKKIYIFLRNKNKKIIIDEINTKYKTDIKIIYEIEDLKEFDNIIDATGSREVLNAIIDKICNHTNLILMGTPREGPTINLLNIHRKNIRIIGAHEINGITEKERQKLFSSTLKFCSRNMLKSLESFIVIHNYTKTAVKEAIQDRNNIIHIFKY